MRVLKAHREAVANALPDAREALLAGGSLDEFCATIAEAVVAAEDGITTRFCVLTRHESMVTAYGPFPTSSGATKAIQAGGMLGDQAGVWPLVPFPKRDKPAKRAGGKVK